MAREGGSWHAVHWLRDVTAAEQQNIVF